MIKKTGEIPYSWELIEEQIREAIIAQAAVLSMYGPNSKVDETYLGIDLSDSETADELSDVSRAKIDIRRHFFYHLVRDAYIYAYQLDGSEELCDEFETIIERWGEVSGLLCCFPQYTWEGEPTPLCPLNEKPLRRVLETFHARVLLFEEEADLNIFQLSLLANMTVPAVRTSLSKEGFKLEKSNRKSADKQDPNAFVLNPSSSITWLSRRRGFIPQRPAEQTKDQSEIATQLLFDEDSPFPIKVKRLLSANELNAEQVPLKSGIDSQWFKELLDGAPAKLDIDALRSLATLLSVPVPEFVGLAVKHLLALECQ